MKTLGLTTMFVGLLGGLLAGAGYAQSASEGEQIFRKCVACHQLGDGAKNRAGPVLTGIVGSAAGAAESFRYSASLRAAADAGLVWSSANLFEYLADPTGFLRLFLDDPKARSKMSFKLRQAAFRQNVIAYLAGVRTTAADPWPDRFCIVNSSPDTMFLTTETREGARAFSSLAPGGQLCSATTAHTDGIISVFESEDSFEGCSRIVPVGRVEEMLEFAAFDRCGWGSHNS